MAELGISTMTDLWARYRQYLCSAPELGFSLDVSRVLFEQSCFDEAAKSFAPVFDAMAALERGSIANPDEGRMVGHYWLRDPQLAPTREIQSEITETLSRIKKFASDVHTGAIAPQAGGVFKHLLVVGIGGSALGPQFVSQALSTDSDKMDLYFFDNTDPDGMDQVISSIPDLARTLCVVISKSGGTKETRNGQLVAKAALERAGVPFARNFVAVTMAGSELERTALAEKWLARFPMWDWIGGRTSELSAVGLLPAALQGFDIDGLLEGARQMDGVTRQADLRKNPAALLAFSWFSVGCGKGLKDMVILPYKDRLGLLSRYLQQLVMESLGKELDLAGNVVNQGIAVYGNKGSTDQHAYVQQLRDGLNNFFAIFIEVLRDRADLPRSPSPFSAATVEVEEGITSGDYLQGFFLGTRTALFERERQSITITVDEVGPRSVGMLIALFERAVGLYASLVNINAYHQPGVEAGKKAAANVLELQRSVVAYLRSTGGSHSLDEIARGLKAVESTETIYKVLERLGANNRIKVERSRDPFSHRYSV